MSWTGCWLQAMNLNARESYVARSIPRPVQQLLHVVYAPDARSQRLVDYLRTWKAPAEAESEA